LRGVACSAARGRSGPKSINWKRRRLQREGKSDLLEVAQLTVAQPTVAQWAAAVEPAPLVVAGRGCLAHAARGGPPSAAPVAVGGGIPLAAPAPLVVMKRINSLSPSPKVHYTKRNSPSHQTCGTCMEY